MLSLAREFYSQLETFSNRTINFFFLERQRIYWACPSYIKSINVFASEYLSYFIAISKGVSESTTSNTLSFPQGVPSAAGISAVLQFPLPPGTSHHSFTQICCNFIFAIQLVDQAISNDGYLGMTETLVLGITYERKYFINAIYNY